MDILNQMVQLMDRKEVKNFKIYISRAWEGDDKDRKDIRLFDLIRKSPDNYSDEKAFSKIYDEGTDKNAFYRLKNRLMEDINKSLFLQQYRESGNLHTLYLLALAYSYYKKNNYRLAHHFLKKAEKKAREIENYSLLDDIYSRLIYTSREMLLREDNPEFYIKKRRENRAVLNKMSEIEDILEAVEYRMKISQNLSSGFNVNELLQIAMNDYTNDDELKDSPRLQLGIYLIVSRVLLQNKDYISLEDYLISTYKNFEEKKFFNKANHSHKLQMLGWIANALFMNKKFARSLEYAEVLKREMERHESLLYDKYEFFYYNILVINFSEINQSKAIEILLELATKKHMDKMTFNGVFVYLNLAVLYCQQKQFRPALKYINKLYNYEEYKTTDTMLQLRISLGELIMRHGLKDLDVLEYRFRQVQKQFAEILENNEGWEKELLSFFGELISFPKTRQNPAFRQKTQLLVENIQVNSTKEEMLFGYDSWLKSLINSA